MSFCGGCRKERVSASHSFPHLETDGDSGSRYNQYSLQQEVQYRAEKHCGPLNRKPSPICVPCRSLSGYADLVCSPPNAYYCSVYTIMSSQTCFQKQYNYNRLKLRAVQRRDCIYELNPKIFTESLKRTSKSRPSFQTEEQATSQSVINLRGKQLQVIQRDLSCTCCCTKAKSETTNWIKQRRRTYALLVTCHGKRM